jgi:hypothetical protein
MARKSRARISSKEAKRLARECCEAYQRVADKKEAAEKALDEVYHEITFGRGRKSFITSRLRLILKGLPLGGDGLPDEIVYDKGSPYNFFQDASRIMVSAKSELFVADSFVDKKLFQLYIDTVPSSVMIRLLTNPNNPHKQEATTLCGMVVKSGRSIEMRESLDCHDRLIITDSAAWVCGQSLKDAGKKPTYLVRIYNHPALRAIFMSMWNIAKKV